MLTHQALRERITYDPATGVFEWRTRAGRGGGNYRGVAGTPHNRGYWIIRVCGRQYLAHRLAHFYMLGEWPAAGLEIDHRNGDKLDNRWRNLRVTDRSGNQCNKACTNGKTSSFKGVDLHRGYWRARVKVRGKVVSKTFSDELAAAKWRNEKAQELHGEFAR